MARRFTPYVGTSPYIFLSYSRGDTEQMLGVAHGLFEKSYRLWYDEGIPPGDDWAANIGEHMTSAGAVIFFLSAKALVSPNCFSEVKTAHDAGKSIICIFCDECSEIVRCALDQKRLFSPAEAESVAELCRPYRERRKDKQKIPPAESWLPVLSGAAFISGRNDDYSAQEKDILATGLLDKRYIGPYAGGGGGGGGNNKWLTAIILSIAVFAAALTGAWAIRTGRVVLPGQDAQGEAVGESSEPAAAPAPVPTVDPEKVGNFFGTVTFPDTTQSDAVNLMTGLPTDGFKKADLALITELHACGNLASQDGEGIIFSNGRWYLNDAPVIQGNVSDLSLIGQMYYLESLTLVYQNVTGISALSELPLLKTLDLAGNPIEKIDSIDGLPSLEEIDLSHTGVKDLSGLDLLPSLKRVYVSADMLPLEPDSDVGYEVILVY